MLISTRINIGAHFYEAFSVVRKCSQMHGPYLDRHCVVKLIVYWCNAAHTSHQRSVLTKCVVIQHLRINTAHDLQWTHSLCLGALWFPQSGKRNDPPSNKKMYGAMNVYKPGVFVKTEHKFYIVHEWMFAYVQLNSLSIFLHKTIPKLDSGQR